MKKLRPAFGLYLAISAIIILLVFIGYMIFKLNTIDATTIYQEDESIISNVKSPNEQDEVTAQYLEGLQNYKLRSGNIVTEEESKSNDKESLVTRSSEESNNSISVKIDTIVGNALMGGR